VTIENDTGKLEALKNKYGYNRVTALFCLLIVGASSLSIQLLFFKGWGNSALLYMLVPFLISLFIAFFLSDRTAKTIGEKMLRHNGYALIVFFSTSILLREGFVCVVFFMPIYLLIVNLIMFVYLSIEKNKKSKLHSVGLSALFILMSFEGTTNFLSFDRELSVQVSQKTALSVDQIKTNLAMPFELEKDRHWMLMMFPMPYHIEAGSLNAGDIHTMKTRYHRWFFTNTHEGEAQLLIEKVNDNAIRTKILKDTTYFSNYIKLHGTEIQFDPVADGTEVTLTIHFQRKLDPAWYFQPLQKFAFSRMGEFLIEEIMIRE